MRSLLSCIFVRKLIIHQSASYGISFKKVVKWCKYYDLALQGDPLAKEHYLTLEKKASDCIRCGHCNSRCPFQVMQMERMDEIKNYFGQ